MELNFVFFSEDTVNVAAIALSAAGAVVIMFLAFTILFLICCLRKNKGAKSEMGDTSTTTNSDVNFGYLDMADPKDNKFSPERIVSVENEYDVRKNSLYFFFLLNFL